MINPTSWDVISPDGDQQKVASLNTPELKQQTPLVYFAISNPAAAALLAGQTPAESQARANAMALILNPHPMDLGTWIASHTHEQQQEIKQAIAAILMPASAQ